MLRIAIVEDTADDRARLKDYLEKISNECGETSRITEFFDGAAFLESYRPDYDLVLMDIEMPHLNGMETARELRMRDARVLLIFITNIAQYALNGYEVDALDYMLKPVNYYALALKLKKAQRILRERTGGSMMLPFDGVLRRTPIQSILYVEVSDHKLCYHTYDGESHLTGSMKELEQSLASSHFVRCNNCYLVNLAHVSSVSTDTVWVESDALKISRPKRKTFMQALSDYYGGGGR